MILKKPVSSASEDLYDPFFFEWLTRQGGDLFVVVIRTRLIPAFLLLAFALAISGCAGEDTREKQLERVLRDNPEIFLDSISEHPLLFIETIQAAVYSSKQELTKRHEQKKRKRVQKYYEKPLEPKIRGDEAHKGPQDGELILVVYSDFQCPFSRRGHETVKLLLDLYQKEMTYVYKHLPLSMESQSMKAARYFEALRHESPSQAMDFHDYIFENQNNFSMGDDFLTKAVNYTGSSREYLDEVIASNPEIEKRIREDIKEADKFNIRGTPGFVLNGVVIEGAHPTERFVEIIDELRSREIIHISEN